MKKFYLLFILSFIIQYGFCQFERMPLNYPHDAIAHLPTRISIVDANTLWVGTWRTNSWTSWLPYSNAAKSSDGGNNWSFYPIPVTGMQFVSDVEAWDANTCYYLYQISMAGGGQIWKTSNGGTSWTLKTTSQFDGGYPDFIHLFSRDSLIAVGDPTSGYFEIQNSSDGGNTWTRVPSNNLPIVSSGEAGFGGKAFGAIGNTIWFGTSKARCYKSVDKGYHWTVSQISTDTTLFGWWQVSFSDQLHGVACRSNQSPILYYLTSDGGTSWTPLSTMLTGYVYPWISRVDGIYCGFVVAAQKPTGMMPTSVFFTNDFFANVSVVDSNLYSYYNYIYFKDASIGWLSGAYGNDSTILKFTDVLTSVNDKKPSSESLRIVPNPSNQFALVTFPIDIVGHIKTVQILDFSGRMIQDFSIGRNEISLRINSSSYTNGVYNIEVITDNGLQKNARWVICH